MFAVPENTVALVERPAHRHPVRVALEYAANRESWRQLLRYDPQERFATLLAEDEDQEVWLMGWLPGQEAQPHDHAESTGAFTVVSGILSETVTRRNSRGGAVTELHVLDAGQSRVFGPGYVHQVRNDGIDPAVSVHVYRSGGRAMRPYQVDPITGFTRR
jgi:predicted metal-dependent enzyme (double-stranded beta helix superfamily)